MSEQVAPITDAAIAAAGSKATYTGAGMTISGWFLSSEFAVLSGLLLGLAGLAVNWYYRHKEDARRQAEHLLFMQKHERDRAHADQVQSPEELHASRSEQPKVR